MEHNNYMEEKSVYQLFFKYFLLFEMLSIIISVLSLGLLTPLVLYYRYKKETESTIISGKRLIFKGKLIDAYKRYILWMIITFIIIVSYQYFISLIIDNFNRSLPPVINTIITSTVITFLSSVFIKSSFRRWKYKSIIIDNQESYYKGNMLLVIVTSMIRKLLNIISICIFYPLIKEISYKYEIRGVIVSSRKLTCKAISKELYKTWFINLLWLILSLGLYFPYMIYRLNKILVANLELSNLNLLTIKEGEIK